MQEKKAFFWVSVFMPVNQFLCHFSPLYGRQSTLLTCSQFSPISPQCIYTIHGHLLPARLFYMFALDSPAFIPRLISRCRPSSGSCLSLLPCPPPGSRLPLLPSPPPGSRLPLLPSPSPGSRLSLLPCPPAWISSASPACPFFWIWLLVGLTTWYFDPCLFLD